MCMSEYAYGILNWLGNRTYQGVYVYTIIRVYNYTTYRGTFGFVGPIPRDPQSHSNSSCGVRAISSLTIVFAKLSHIPPNRNSISASSSSSDFNTLKLPTRNVRLGCMTFQTYCIAVSHRWRSRSSQIWGRCRSSAFCKSRGVDTPRRRTLTYTSVVAYPPSIFGTFACGCARSSRKYSRGVNISC